MLLVDRTGRQFFGKGLLRGKGESLKGWRRPKEPFSKKMKKRTFDPSTIVAGKRTGGVWRIRDFGRIAGLFERLVGDLGQGGGLRRCIRDDCERDWGAG